MSVFIIAALTADGFIGKNSNHLATEWTSKEDKQYFTEVSKKAGVVVMGINTFKTIGKPLKDRLNIVYAQPGTSFEGVEVTQKSPKDLIQDLEKRGYNNIAICGGSTIYTMFMEAGVVDKIYLTIEPILFGAGLNLFNKELNEKLQLQSVKNLNESTLALEYKVVND